MNDRPDTLCKPVEAKTPLKACFEVAEVVACAVLAIAILFTFVLRFAGVEGASMEPTFSDNDWLTITAVANPRAGDVVIISPRDNDFQVPLVKRVIAVAGQQVDLRGGYVYVNGFRIDETPYLGNATGQTEGANGGLAFPLTVPENTVFVLGDNRTGSTDSRNAEIGFVRVDDILGRVMMRMFPNWGTGFNHRFSHS
ncbi:MAG: signal peptidase I [Oscillospiraceae bacterium]|nr:signal peptidase I [Oscillospiraceae bacterium]